MFKLLMTSRNVTTNTLNSQNLEPETLLNIAVQDGLEDCVLLILEAGADVNIRTVVGGETSLILAAGRESYRMVEWLIQHDAFLNLKNDTGNTALCTAASKGMS